MSRIARLNYAAVAASLFPDCTFRPHPYAVFPEGPAQRYKSGPLLRALDASGVRLDDAELRRSVEGIDLTTAEGGERLINLMIGALTRTGINTGISNFPVRENLEAVAKALVPIDTPFRNMLPRSGLGMGLASTFFQQTSLGGGWGTGYDQPGGGSAAQLFYAETGAPATLTSTYAKVTATYKYMGSIRTVTRQAMASGASFMPQYTHEVTSALMNLMLQEEFALINGDSTSTSVPWGDGGGNALAYDGIINLVATANGTPSANISTSVGALTQAHVDAQLNLIWKQGGTGNYILCNIQEAQSLTALLEANGSINRLIGSAFGDNAGKMSMGLYIPSYIHPASGEQVEIIRSRFVPAGTMIFGSKYGPRAQDGPPLDVEVLPQVEMPAMAPTENVQGYAVQPLAPTITAIDVLPIAVSLYSVLRFKNPKVFAKSTGLTAVT